MVTITSKTYDPESGWTVECTVVLPSGTRGGRESVALGEDATEAQLKAAILKAYA